MLLKMLLSEIMMNNHSEGSFFAVDAKWKSAEYVRYECRDLYRDATRP
jgi:hypothetical protein